MLPNFLRLVLRPAPPGTGAPFVAGVRVERKRPRNRRVERLIAACWILIAAKCALVAWATGHYRMPFSPLWVILPTIAFAALCTGVYWFRRL
jgi:peptidoglycan/LPS O-acetylase OafA/YrhL